MKNKRAYFSIETVLVAGLVIALGAYALSEFYNVSQDVTHASNAKILDAMGSRKGVKRKMENDYHMQLIKVLADEEECVFIIPTSVLRQANMDTNDKCIVVAEPDKLIIRKVGEDA